MDKRAIQIIVQAIERFAPLDDTLLEALDELKKEALSCPVKNG